MSYRSHTRIIHSLICAALGLGVVPDGVFAAPITFAQSVVQQVDADNNSIGPSSCFDFSATSGTTTSCTGTIDDVAGVSMLTYDVSATAEQGTLKASGSSSISTTGTGADGPYGYNSTGTAVFRDVWTVGGGSGTGMLQFDFTVTGTYDSGDVNTSVFTGLGFQNLTLGGSSLDPTFPDFNASFTTPFTFGTPFEFLFSLVAGSGLSSLEEGGYDGQSSSMDMSSTAVLSGIVVRDASGAVVPFTLQTGSGAAYYQSLVPSGVPEPASLILLGAGLIGSAVRRRYTHSHSA